MHSNEKLTCVPAIHSAALRMCDDFLDGVGGEGNAASPAAAPAVDESFYRRLPARMGNASVRRRSPVKTLAASVKVFGIGGNPADTERTSSPALVLVKSA